jgi:rhodanese-related sulfurtransferase
MRKGHLGSTDRYRGLVFWLLLLLFSVNLAGCGATQSAEAPVVAGALAPGRISPNDYQANFVDKQQKHLLIDVRTQEEYASSIIAGAINIPLQEVQQRLNELPKDEPVILYCRSGNRSNQAFQLLKDAGYTQIYDLGGIVQWESAGMPVQK